MNTTFERICALLSKDHPMRPEDLRLDAPLSGLGIDSLATIELLWNIEDAFKIKLPSGPVELLTLGDVVRLVDQLVADQGNVGHGLPMAQAAPVTSRLRAP